MNGAEVTHISFGSGKVLSQEGEYIRVSFGAEEKLFRYPDVFSKFLRFEDETLQLGAESALAEKQTEDNRRLQEKLESVKAAQEAARKREKAALAAKRKTAAKRRTAAPKA